MWSGNVEVFAHYVSGYVTITMKLSPLKLFMYWCIITFQSVQILNWIIDLFITYQNLSSLLLIVASFDKEVLMFQ